MMGPEVRSWSSSTLFHRVVSWPLTSTLAVSPDSSLANGERGTEMGARNGDALPDDRSEWPSPSRELGRGRRGRHTLEGCINQGLGDNISKPIDWDESSSAPYFTDRPGYDGYGALLVWAAHAERGTKPPEFYDGEWFSDEAFVECSEPKKGQKYRSIICGSLWLPGDFEFSFDFKNLPAKRSIYVRMRRS